MSHETFDPHGNRCRKLRERLPAFDADDVTASSSTTAALIREVLALRELRSTLTEDNSRLSEAATERDEARAEVARLEALVIETTQEAQRAQALYLDSSAQVTALQAERRRHAAQALTVCPAIEECGASEKLTAAVILASALHSALFATLASAEPAQPAAPPPAPAEDEGLCEHGKGPYDGCDKHAPAAPDKGCVTTADGGCEGTDCMHSRPPPAAPVEVPPHQRTDDTCGICGRYGHRKQNCPTVHGRLAALDEACADYAHRLAELESARGTQYPVGVYERLAALEQKASAPAPLHARGSLTVALVLDNLSEFTRSYLFSLTESDPPHQAHFRACVEAWLALADEALKPHRQTTRAAEQAADAAEEKRRG